MLAKSSDLSHCEIAAFRKVVGIFQIPLIHPSYLEAHSFTNGRNIQADRCSFITNVHFPYAVLKAHITVQQFGNPRASVVRYGGDGVRPYFYYYYYHHHHHHLLYAGYLYLYS